MSFREQWREFWRFKTPTRVWEPYEDDRAKQIAECQVRLAMAVGFLKTIPSDNTSAEEGEAWRGRLARFLQQFDGSAGGSDA